MDAWRRAAAAAAVEARRAELGLTQKDFGIAADTYRDFVSGQHWPQARTRAKIEVKLGWKVGRISELAREAVRGDGAGRLAVITDDPDEKALLLSNLADDVKRRLIARLWAGRRKRPKTQGEEASQEG
jgi:hypothetical protein